MSDTVGSKATATAATVKSNNSSIRRTSSGGSSTSSSASRKRSIRTGTVDSRWLFNNFYVGELVVDARSREAFEAESLLGAISIPPIADCRCLADIDNDRIGKQNLASLSPRKRNLRDIVVIADRAQIRDAKSWMYTLQQLLVDDGLVASVKTLSDCFSEFSKRYHFYTTRAASGTGVIQSGMHRVNYPNEIVEGFLYLGNMWQAESQQVIADLGITHIINATLDLGNVFESKGVFYHDVKIKDESTADISKFFDSTFHFINRAKHASSPSWVTSKGARQNQPYRVLVHCTQGISRSATLVIMYLMRANHWSLVQAFNYTRDGRGVIIPNEGFLRALLQEERRLHETESNSVTESELDLLLQGRITDRPVPPPLPSRRPSNCTVM